jgi:hypothetical protein
VRELRFIQKHFHGRPSLCQLVQSIFSVDSHCIIPSGMVPLDVLDGKTQEKISFYKIEIFTLP